MEVKGTTITENRDSELEKAMNINEKLMEQQKQEFDRILNKFKADVLDVLAYHVDHNKESVLSCVGEWEDMIGLNALNKIIADCKAGEIGYE